VLVGGATANTLTLVTRGYGGTSGVAHGDTNRIALLITQEVFTDATYGVHKNIDDAIDDLATHESDTTNPHSVSAAQLTGDSIVTEINASASLIDDDNIAATIARDSEVATAVSTHAALTASHGVGEIVGTSEAQTLTTKTINGDNNTITDVAFTSLKNPEQQSFTNRLSNGDFESWSAGDSSAPDGWNFDQSGTGGGVAKSSDEKLGDYSAELTKSSTGNSLIDQTANNHELYRGRYVTANVWVKSATTIINTVKIQIYDGITPSDTFYKNSGDWELLTVTRLVDVSATQVKLNCVVVSTADAVAQFDGVILVEGSVAPAFSPKPLIESHKSLTTGMHGVESDYVTKTSKSSQIGEFVATAVVGRSGAVDYLCDGVADDVQIQAAIDFVSLSGGRVLLRSGTYTIDTMLTLSAKGVDLVGENLGGGKYVDTGSTVIKCSATFPTDEDIVFLDTNTDRTSVQNILLDGNDRARDGMSLNQSSNFATFVHCRNCTRYGFYGGDNSGAGNFLDRCIVDNVASDGMHIVRNDYRINHAYIMRCGGAGIRLNGSGGTQIIHSHTFKCMHGIVFDHTSLAVVTSSVIEQNELDAIVFDSTSGACSSNLVGNCVMYSNGQDPDEVPSAGKHVGFVSGLNAMYNNSINNCSFDASTTLINQTVANPSYMKNNTFSYCVGAGTYDIEIPTDKIAIIVSNERIETHSNYIKSEGIQHSPKTVVSVDFGAENKTDTKLYSNDKNNEMFEYSNVTFTDDDKFTGINANSVASEFTSNGDILANFHTVSNCVFNFVLNQDSIVTSNVQADQQYIFKSGDINAASHPRFECYLRNSDMVARYLNASKPVDASTSIPQETGVDNFYSIEINATRMEIWKNGIHHGGTTLSAADRDTILNQLTITLGCTNTIGHWLDVGKLKHFEYAENLTDAEDFIKSSYAHLENKHITPKSIIPFIYEGSAAPSTAPFKVGDVFIDTTADNVYVSKDTSVASDWVRIGGIPTGNFAAPTVPASTVNYTNDFGYTCQVQIKGGTVTEIDIDDIATGLSSGIFIIPNGGTLNITYSVVPTWVWWGL
jgi:hypothetical protein